MLKEKIKVEVNDFPFWGLEVISYKLVFVILPFLWGLAVTSFHLLPSNWSKKFHFFFKHALNIRSYPI